MDNRTQDQRFWPKVSKAGPVPERRPDLGPCWIWTAKRFPNGYGWSWWAGRGLMAHRVAYELEVGPIPPGLVLDHLCFNRSCVRPTHLEPVTQQENVRRAKTHCQNGHEFTPENTYVRPAGGGRDCRACTRRNPQVTGNVLAARNAAKTHCPHGHEYTEANTVYSPRPDGGKSRKCRECVERRRRGNHEKTGV